MPKTEKFISKSIKKHGHIYDYSLVEYTKNNEKVKIICPEHGVFEQVPANHLFGQGCPSCAGVKKLSTETFISKAIKKHGHIYDYSLTEYVHSQSKVKIICSEHGTFEQVPASHLNGNGCPSCAGNIKLTTEDFISSAIQKHGHIYDYSLVEYKGARTKVKIICKEHSVFEQTPNNHLNGNICPLCSGYGGFKQNKPAIFYILKINDKDIWKIGITNKSVPKRYSKSEQKLFSVVRTIPFKIGSNALQLETKLKKQYKEFLYTGSNPLYGGHTEMFTVLPII
jgi:hypothetical protein